MQRLLCLFLIGFFNFAYAQIPAYYDGIDFNKPNTEVQTSLSNLLKDTHQQKLTYTPGVWEALMVLDINPDNSSQVLLIYGSDDEDDVLMNDRTREKYLNCHQTTCTGKWNREHVFPKSIGEFEEDGYAYTDVHALRACDTEMNSYRYNSPYVDGEGDAHEVSPYRFYPGDEWKGDVARMILYMYLRYPNFCKPKYVGIGEANYYNDIPDIFLEWNAEDPVSEFERRRNNLIESNFQGNRNPFIDNPYLATLLWGGPVAEDTWNMLNTNAFYKDTFKIYPNPTQDKIYYKDHAWDSIHIYDELGRLIDVDKDLNDGVTWLPQNHGLYRIEFCHKNSCETYQVIKN